MTGLLASVNDLHEAETVLAVGADIIDLKQPSEGALGALSPELVKTIVNRIAGKKPVSATIGDLPMQPKLIYDKVNQMYETGVNYIKIGLFPEGDPGETLNELKPLVRKGAALIAVFFADAGPDFNFIPTVANAEFKGIMLDTMDKNKGGLTSLIGPTQLDAFRAQAHRFNLLCGLAGSLKASDIPLLVELRPDYLGFRSALCIGQNRTAELDPSAVRLIKKRLSSETAPIHL